MADFDTFLAKQGLNPIYQGDPPTSESDYNSRVTFMDGETAPSWSEIQVGVASETVINKRINLYYDQPGTRNSGMSQGLGIQLEKLYDDIDAGKFGADAKTGQFYTFIKTIKDNNPKP